VGKKALLSVNGKEKGKPRTGAQSEEREQGKNPVQPPRTGKTGGGKESLFYLGKRGEEVKAGTGKKGKGEGDDFSGGGATLGGGFLFR